MSFVLRAALCGWKQFVATTRGFVTFFLCRRHRPIKPQFCYSERLEGARTHEKRE